MKSYFGYQYGNNQFGQGISTSFKLSSAVSVGYTKIRILFSEPAKHWDYRDSDDAMNTSNYLAAGGIRDLHVRMVTMIDPSTYELTVDEMQKDAVYLLSANPMMASDNGSDTLGVNNLAFFTGLGELPRLNTATNSSPGVLNIDFSEAMILDLALQSIGSYVLEPIGVAKPIFVNSLSIDPSLTTRAVLKFTGGGSLYRLTVSGVMDIAGNYIDPNFNSVVFKVTQPGTDEIFSADRYYFDTNLGAIQLSVSSLSRRSVEDLVIMRSKSKGHEKQFQLLVKALRSAGINRDHTKLGLLKG